MTTITPTYLSIKNRHERDKNIVFFEEGHRYLVNGKSGFTSTTTFIHSLFSHFDSDGIISGILKKKEWSDDPEYKYYRMSADEISTMWKKNGEMASKAGTKMHYNIECFFNNMQYENDLKNNDSFALSLMDVDDQTSITDTNPTGGNVDDQTLITDTNPTGENVDDQTLITDTNPTGGYVNVNDDVNDDVDDECIVFPPTIDDGSKEFDYFKKFVDEIVLKEELEPYRTEMLVYDEEIKITGSIDMLYRKNNGEFAIFDWKRSKEILYEGFRGKKSSVKCINHLNDSNFWHYSLQLNIYRRILEKNYGLIVSDLRLVILHPDNNNYICLNVSFLDDEINALFKMRVCEVEKQNV
jgi:hypothetical protein